jgi:ABC-type polysaccharide/polyol phosphate export permease
VFSIHLRFTTEHYSVFVLSGLLPWIWFSSSLLESSGSILAGGNLIKKVLFPAEVLPLVVVFSNCINFLLILPVLLLFAILFKRPIGTAIFALPLVMLTQLILTTGLAFIFSAVCVHYRDIQHILGNLLTLWFFLTPIIIPLEQIPETLRGILLSTNFIAPLVLAYQGIFYNNQFPNFLQLLPIMVISVLMYFLGASIFVRYSGIFAEEV